MVDKGMVTATQLECTPTTLNVVLCVFVFFFFFFFRFYCSNFHNGIIQPARLAAWVDLINKIDYITTDQ